MLYIGPGMGANGGLVAEERLRDKTVLCDTGLLNDAGAVRRKVGWLNEVEMLNGKGLVHGTSRSLVCFCFGLLMDSEESLELLLYCAISLRHRSLGSRSISWEDNASYDAAISRGEYA